MNAKIQTTFDVTIGSTQKFENAHWDLVGKLLKIEKEMNKKYPALNIRISEVLGTWTDERKK